MNARNIENELIDNNDTLDNIRRQRIKKMFAHFDSRVRGQI